MKVSHNIKNLAQNRAANKIRRTDVLFFIVGRSQDVHGMDVLDSLQSLFREVEPGLPNLIGLKRTLKRCWNRNFNHLNSIQHRK